MTALAGFVLLGGILFAQGKRTKDQNNPCPAEENELSKPFPGRRPPIKLKLLKYIAPDYPALAHRAGVQGRVTIQVQITEQGKVENPQILSGHPMLDNAALAAIRQWRYEPACVKGAPVAIDYLIVLNFSLKNGITIE